MDKPNKLNERLTLIANLSVVVGIIFLAVEVRQNTQALQAQTRDSITEKQMEYLSWVATSPELAAAEDKVISDGLAALGGAERRQYLRFVSAQIREWENSFYQYERGLFTEDELEARRNRWRGAMTGAASGAAYRAWWQIIRGSFAPSFRAEIDRIVAEVGG